MAAAAEQDGAEAVGASLDDCLPGMAAVRLFRLDLVDQHHRVADDHPGEGEHAEHCHEAHGLIRKEQSRDDPDEAQWGHAEHQKQLAEALELDHQHREDQNEHEWQSGDDRRLRLGALLNAAPNRDVVPARQAGTQYRDLRR